MEQRDKIVGVLNIVWRTMLALGGLVGLLVFGSAFGIVGTATRHEPDAAIALPIIRLVGCGILLLPVLLSVSSIIADIGLLKFMPWSRVLAIVVSPFHPLRSGTLVIPAVHASGVEVLYSEDLSDRQTYGSARVANPFVGDLLQS